MTVQGLGASGLAALMRSDRRRDSDSSWLLFGPGEPPLELDQHQQDEPQEPWRFAAE